MTFWIRYGTFSLCEWEEIEVGSYDEACEEAYINALQDYEMYEGIHGIRTVDEIMEEDEVSEEEAVEIYNEEKENTIQYEVTDERPD